MNNIALFMCGLIVTLFCGMGILVYTVSLGYDKKKLKPVKIEIDMGAANKSMDSFSGIPSVS